MKVVFRVDSSEQIGSGHLMRCLTLARQFHKEKKAEILFLSRDLPGNLTKLVLDQGYCLVLFQRIKPEKFCTGYASWLTVTQDEDAKDCIEILHEEMPIDVLVVDSYAIDETWERQIRPLVRKIFAIDDLANRKHDCDFLLDQNFYLDKNMRYQGLVPENCLLLLGPQHALLREEFYEAKKHLRKRDGRIKNILVFYGGSDRTNETIKALQAIVRIDGCNRLTVNVIVGSSNPYRDEVKDFCQQYEFLHYYCQVDNIAKFMNEADLSLGAGGTTIWERCFLGLPTIVTAVAENQLKICEDCAKAGYIVYLGINKTVTVQTIYRELLRRCIETDDLEKIQRHCRLDVKCGNDIGIIFAAS